MATENDPAYELSPPAALAPHYRIVTIENDPTKGRSAAAKRNYGASLAKSPWLAMIDDDCLADANWLLNARDHLQNQDCAGLEGYTHIPKPEKSTLTYKGICRLGRPGGYQTCNIFYRREEFIDLGGFDPNFPFYLEDTDWAWTLLEQGYRIPFASSVRVDHPVPSPEPKRLLANSLRMRKLPYLAKKHPKIYKQSKMRAYPRPYAIFLPIDLAVIGTIISTFFAPLILWPLIGLVVLRIALTGLYMGYLFRGQLWTVPEVSQTFFYTLIGPGIGFFQLMRGNIENRTFLFLR